MKHFQFKSHLGLKGFSYRGLDGETSWRHHCGLRRALSRFRLERHRWQPGEDAAKSGNHNARLFRISLNLEWSNSISDCQRFLKCLQVCSSWWFEDYWNLVEHQVWHYWSGRIPASWWAWTLGPDLRHLGERERGQCAFYRKVRGLEEEGEKRSNTQILRSWEKEPFSDDGRAWSDLSSSLSHLADNHSDMCCHNLHQEMRGNLAVPLFSCFFLQMPAMDRWSTPWFLISRSLHSFHIISIHSPLTNR